MEEAIIGMEEISTQHGRGHRAPIHHTYAEISDDDDEEGEVYYVEQEQQASDEQAGDQRAMYFRTQAAFDAAHANGEDAGMLQCQLPRCPQIEAQNLCADHTHHCPRAPPTTCNANRFPPNRRIKEARCRGCLTLWLIVFALLHGV